ncbi:hypothetical protein GCM10010377_23620 [Streptomyces viridiviolaceus]|uniref:SDR family oxidoreductase n=1 Tax=Streptomyces viridiviolaceus TaxID=68282 RepID=A0ABW2DWQ2_9ACTN|nr:SDR family oxidoreductase [Streptomyces viridiviolaceus]GHB32506.1 hypothetical protein GCM10010377_23620 [Streptomyces viridiviolaceus]
MAERFAGRTAIITGAGRGIGLAIAERLVADGAKVVITGRKPDAPASAVAALGGADHALAVAGHAADTAHQDEEPGIGMYGAGKAMLMHLTKELAIEVSPRVRVNAVAPAVVKTRFAAALHEGREDAVAAEYPLARLGAPDDIAGVVAYLLSGDAEWMTGRTLVVDGGLAAAGGA